MSQICHIIDIVICHRYVTTDVERKLLNNAIKNRIIFGMYIDDIFKME